MRIYSGLSTVGWVLFLHTGGAWFLNTLSARWAANRSPDDRGPRNKGNELCGGH
jgi:dipeptidase